MIEEYELTDTLVPQLDFSNDVARPSHDSSNSYQAQYSWDDT
jgi:hypothetical protein